MRSTHKSWLTTALIMILVHSTFSSEPRILLTWKEPFLYHCKAENPLLTQALKSYWIFFLYIYIYLKCILFKRRYISLKQLFPVLNALQLCKHLSHWKITVIHEQYSSTILFNKISNGVHLLFSVLKCCNILARYPLFARSVIAPGQFGMSNAWYRAPSKEERIS